MCCYIHFAYSSGMPTEKKILWKLPELSLSPMLLCGPQNAFEAAMQLSLKIKILITM